MLMIPVFTAYNTSSEEDLKRNFTMIGISFTLGGQNWGTGDFWGQWASKVTEQVEWTEESRRQKLGETVMRINQLLIDAKVSHIAELKDVPIEVTFDNQRLLSWRVLTEVL